MLIRFLPMLIALGSLCLGNAQAELRAGDQAYEQGDFARAVRELEPAAEQGDVKAEIILGTIYWTGGKGVTRDDRKALAWFRRAADQGNAEAQDLVGIAYVEGRGVAKNPAEAVAWFRRSAEQGDADGEFSLGFSYFAGEGVKRDAKTGVAWLEKSAAQDFPPAEEMLGRIYISGAGVAADEKLGLQWLHKAANHGLSDAEASLGMAYAEGVGTRRDKVQAFKWLQLAVPGLPAGKLRDKVTAARNTLAEAMTPAQRERADGLVAKFEPVPMGGKRSARGAAHRQSEPEIAGPIATGSGFVISDQGHIVTNDHVVAECGHMRIRHLGPDGMAAEVVARDSSNDLAVLKIAAPTTKIAAFRTGAEIRPGDGVVAVGFPLTGILAEDANVTIGGVSALAGLRNDQRYLQISAPVQPGNSGGPLLDLSGHVIGVVSAKLDAARIASVTGDIPQNVNFAIKISVVRQFLDANHIPYRGVASAAHLEAADVGEQARAFTALVECWK